MDLLLHPLVVQGVARYVQAPTHALLLVAPAGSGKQAVSYYLAAQLLGIEPASIEEHPFVKVVLPEKGKTAISIEAIRELQHFTKLKLPSADARRAIIVPDAHLMTTEAQNALLKLLEEPPANTFFILTASAEQQLLPTVRSRTQKLEIRRPARNECEHYFTEQGCSSKDIAQAYLMSGGLPGLMHALLADTEHPLKTSVQTARELLRATQFERLCKVDELAKQRVETLQVLFMLRQMADAAIEQAGNNQAIKRWHSILTASYNAENALLQSASAKLVLTNLMLAL